MIQTYVYISIRKNDKTEVYQFEIDYHKDNFMKKKMSYDHHCQMIEQTTNLGQSKIQKEDLSTK